MAVGSTASFKGNSSSNGQADYTFPLIVLTSLFFIWGFLTCLNDILIPHLKAVFDLNYTQAMLIQFTFFTAYAIISIPAGYLVEKIGYKTGIVTGLIIAGIGLFMFYPAAEYRVYLLFLAALFIMATGITILQVAANPYVTILGKPETAASRLNLTQAFNSLGTTVAPIFGAAFILSTAVKSADEISAMAPDVKTAYQAAEAASVQVPYIGLAIALIAVALVFAFIKLPTVTAHSASEDNSSVVEGKNAWAYRHLILGAIGIFVYVGAEVSIGSFLVNYLGADFTLGLQEADAGKLLSFYWGGAMVGRFAGAYIQRYVKPQLVLGINGVMAALLVVVSMMTSGHIAAYSMLAVGLFNSIMFPTIFTLAVAGLGKHTGQGSGIVIAAIVGGAIIPVLQGALADYVTGLHLAFILPVLCYFYIAYYGFRGSEQVVNGQKVLSA